MCIRDSAFIVPPPGVNVDHLEEEMGKIIADRIEPYMRGVKQPQMKNYFFVVWSGGVFMGGRAVDNDRVDELVPVINQAIRGFPDTIAFAKRASLFGSFGAGRTVDMNLQGRSVEAITKAALVAYITATRSHILATIPKSCVMKMSERSESFWMSFSNFRYCA